MKNYLIPILSYFVISTVYALPTLEDAKTAKVAPITIEPTQKRESIEPKLDGENNGEARYYHPNGQLYGVINWKMGKKDGPVKLYREDATIEEYNEFKDGLLNGTVIKMNSKEEITDFADFYAGKTWGWKQCSKTVPFSQVNKADSDMYKLTLAACQDKVELKQKTTQKQSSEKKYVGLGHWVEATGDRIIVRDKPSLDKWETYGYLSKGMRGLVIDTRNEAAVVDGVAYRWIKIRSPRMTGWLTDRHFVHAEEPIENNGSDLKNFYYSDAFIESKSATIWPYPHKDTLLLCRENFVSELRSRKNTQDFSSICKLGINEEHLTDDPIVRKTCEKIRSEEGLSIVSGVKDTKLMKQLIEDAGCSELMTEKDESFYVISDQIKKIDINELIINYEFRITTFDQQTADILDLKFPTSGLIYKSKGQPNLKKMKAKSENLGTKKGKKIENIFKFESASSGGLSAIKITQDQVSGCYLCECESDTIEPNHISLSIDIVGKRNIFVSNFDASPVYVKLTSDLYYDEVKEKIYLVVEEEHFGSFRRKVLLSIDKKSFEVESRIISSESLPSRCGC